MKHDSGESRSWKQDYQYDGSYIHHTSTRLLDNVMVTGHTQVPFFDCVSQISLRVGVPRIDEIGELSSYASVQLRNADGTRISLILNTGAIL